MSNTGPTGPEFLEGKKCPSCGMTSVSKNGTTRRIGYIEGVQNYCCHKCGCQWNSLQYPNYEGPSLKQRFEAVVEEYLTVFCKKQGLDRSNCYWIGERLGEVFETNDGSFDFRDIRYDIDTNQPPKQIIEWYWERLKLDDDTTRNYENWIKLKTQ